MTQECGITALWSVCKDALSYSEIIILFRKGNILGLALQVSRNIANGIETPHLLQFRFVLLHQLVIESNLSRGKSRCCNKLKCRISMSCELKHIKDVLSTLTRPTSLPTTGKASRNYSSTWRKSQSIGGSSYDGRLQHRFSLFVPIKLPTLARP